jgi:hypothetical protein
MVKEIFLGLHSPEYAETVYKQVEHDSGKAGFGDSSIALFGEPGTGKFEFVLTGRHCTRRCDGDSVKVRLLADRFSTGTPPRVSTRSPIIPAMCIGIRPSARTRFPDARWQAARDRAPRQRPNGTRSRNRETERHLGKSCPGIAVGDLSADQKAEVRKVMGDLLAPFRKQDADEALRYIEAAGFDKLHMAFYKNQDIGSDGVWDVWQIEGPNMVWYFRGDPHVHVWVNVRASA